jgi:hypothetical protein
MAKFLWTSRSTETFAGSTADHIAKYCFNAPGNWRVFNEVTRVWGLTTGTPGLNPLAQDQVYIGAMNFPSGLGWTYGPSGDNGWTSAKHPLLFGGYSGGFRGNWRYLKSDAGIIAGTSWTGYLGRFDHNVTNSLPFDSPGYPTDNTVVTSQASRTLFHNNVIDYPFPYLGGGITGEIAEWCAARDGLTVGDYVVGNYPGFHDPTKNLRLRVLGGIVLQDLRAFTGPDQKMIIDIEPVRSPSSSVLSDTDFPGTNITNSFGWETNPYLSGRTELFIKTCNGVGVRIRGGHLYTVDCNSSQSLDVSGPISPLHVHGRGRLPSERIDYGIEIHDATVMKCNIADGQRTLLRNGNYAKITLLPRYAMGYHRPYVRVGAGWTGTWTNQGGVMYHTPPNIDYQFIGITALDHRGMVEMPYNFNGSILNGGVTRFPCDSPPIILANGWNWLKCWWELRGISLGAIDQYPSSGANGKLIFDSSTGVNGYFNTPYYRLGTLQSMFYEPGVQNIANNIHPNPPFGFTPYGFSKQRRNVILGDPENPDFEGANVPNGYQALTGGISEIVVSNITNYLDTARDGIDAEGYAHADQSQELSTLQLPWNLQIASKANIQKINMDNGFMTLSPNLSAAHTVRVNEINLKRNSTIDLSDTKSADFRVGTIFYAPGFSGANGQAYLQGGIKFRDSTCNKIIGSIPHAYWNEINYESTNRGIRHFSAGEIAGGYTATDQSI